MAEDKTNPDVALLADAFKNLVESYLIQRGNPVRITSREIKANLISELYSGLVMALEKQGYYFNGGPRFHFNGRPPGYERQQRGYER